MANGARSFSSCTVISIIVIVIAIAIAIAEQGLCKECTNSPTQPSSHTFRYALLSSSDPHAFLNSTAKHVQHALAAHLQDATGRIYTVPDDPPPAVRRALEVHHPITLQEVSLHDVRLLPDSLQGTAQQTNLDYLLMLDVDRLVWSFRNTSNLSTPGSPYGGWESPSLELRGHFVGHYMSATALMWASTHNKTLHQKMTALVDALYECQEKIGTGYLSAFPSEFFDRFEQIKPVWAPYYTIHKIMAGLLDQFTYAGNTKAFRMAVKMADYFNERVLSVIQMYTIERHWLSLNEETGGMNDVLYRLFTFTGNLDHLRLAHLFDKPCFLGLLAVEADSISGFHSNTHIPVVVGAQMRYEAIGDEIYKDISAYFMDIVNSSHSYPTGGTSYGEFWTDPLHLGDTLSSTENEESCTTYNMLKVSRHLFRWTRQMKYVDYYERAVINGVLSIQRGQEPGVMIYMLPIGKGYSKAISYHGWGTQFNSFWCCYGTGIESFAKLGDSIYFEESGGSLALYVVQFVSSSVAWNSVGLVLYQAVSDLSSNSSSLHAYYELSDNDKGHQMANSQLSTNATIKIRIPFWAEPSSGNVSINDETSESALVPGEFLTVTREWEAGDRIAVSFRVTLRAEKVQDDRVTYGSLHAIFFGPYLLAAMSTGDWDISGVDVESLSDWITPISDLHKRSIYSFSQKDSMHHFLACSQNNCWMDSPPKEGTNEAAWSTFRLADPVSENLVTQSSLDPMLPRMTQFVVERPMIYMKTEMVAPQDNLVGKLVAIEPFSHPGNYLRHGAGKSIGVVRSSCGLAYGHPSGIDAVFYIIPGLSLAKNSVSFEAVSEPGCFLSRHAVDLSRIHLDCEASNKTSSRKASTFLVNQPTASYHPMTFVTKAENHNFLLFPLISYKDENYTVFLNITPSSQKFILP